MKISSTGKWCCAITFFVLVAAFGVNWEPSRAQDKKEEAKPAETTPAAEKKAETAPPDAKKEEPKAEEKKAEEPKPEETKTDETKKEEPKKEETPPPVRPYMSPTLDGTAPAWPDAGGGAAGVWATPSSDPTKGGDNPKALTNEDLYDRIAHNLFSINTTWILICGFLVMFMQAGFALVEGGLCRAKNSAHTFAMNMMVYPLGCLAFWAYGYAIGWGNWWNAPVGPAWYSPMGPGTVLMNEGFSINGYGICGTKGFFLMGIDDVSVMTLFFFMMVFMDTTATIPTGTMAERWGWKNFCIFGLWVALPYCLYANWVWGGGWLAQSGQKWGLGHGTVDFAGSSVVHAMGGAIALAGGIVIGPRIGKYIDKKPQAIPGHNIPFVIIGTFVLAFGWFGFNAGSSLSGTDLRVSTVVVNTMLASVTGALSCMVYMMATGMKPDPSMMCNGMLAGLVAVTAPCAFIDSWAAALIGAIAGVLVVISVFFWDRVGVDDPVGAISVHGVGGTFGTLCVGIFANGKYGGYWNGVEGNVKGILYGDYGQLMAQALACVTVWVFGFTMAYVWFKLSNLIFPIRVTADVEVQGLDGPEMGALGYPDFIQK
jgi:Amt family ammonium transporter